jgi:AcrR family transcriptional regulator
MEKISNPKLNILKAGTSMEGIKKNRRQKILQAAFDLFCTKGYEQVTFADIANAIGKGRTTIYEYFPNKEELFIQCVNDVMRDYLIKAKQALAQGETLTQKLQAFIKVQLKFSLYHRNFHQLVRAFNHSKVIQTEENFQRVWNSHLEVDSLLKVVLQEAMAKGEINTNLSLDLFIQLLINATSFPLEINESNHPGIEGEIADIFLKGITNK